MNKEQNKLISLDKWLKFIHRNRSVRWENADCVFVAHDCDYDIKAGTIEELCDKLEEDVV